MQRLIFSIVIISIILVLVLLLTACSSEAQSTRQPRETNTVVSLAPSLQVTVSEARAFDRPSRDAEVLFTLIEGDSATVLTQTEPDSLNIVWYQVAKDQKYGWVAGSQVEVQGDTSQLRTMPLEVDDLLASASSPEAASTDSASPTEPPTIDGVEARITATEAIVFDTPQRDAEERLRLFSGETAAVIGKTTEDALGDVYYLVERNGQLIGWLLGSQVELRGEVASLPTVEDAASVALSQVLPDETADADLVQAPSEEPETSRTSTETLLPTDVPTTTEAVAQASPITPTDAPASFFTSTITPDLGATAIAQPSATTAALVLSTPTTVPDDVETVQTPSPTPDIREGAPPPFEITLLPGWQARHILGAM